MKELSDKLKLALDLFSRGYTGAQIGRALGCTRQRVNGIRLKLMADGHLTQEMLDNPKPITLYELPEIEPTRWADDEIDWYNEN